MRSIGGRACVALLLACAAASLTAQDTTATIRHLLPLDISRVQPFHRTYDMVTRVRDSSIVIGQRDLELSEATYAGVTAWLLVETRTGAVPAAESLYLASDLRPIHWSSTLGAARLGLEFVGDSILGATTSPLGRRNVLLASQPDVIVSVGMAEVILATLPMNVPWADSVNVLTIDLASAQLRPAALSITEPFVAALKADQAETILSFAADSGTPVSISMSVPRHVGDRLEYRARPPAGTAAPP